LSLSEIVRSNIWSSAWVRSAVLEDVLLARSASRPSSTLGTEPLNAFDSNGRDEEAALLLDGG